MKAEVLSKFNQPWLPVTAELLFLAIFLVVIIYVLRKKNQSLFIEEANLPLKDDQKEVDHGR
ncbi:MAG: cbb3-type cytochrome oxidase subunit 3 [Bacteriovoracaceae bacterium]